MREREYIEGPKALENFERGMKALFKVPKAITPKKRMPKTSSVRKTKRSDKD